MHKENGEAAHFAARFIGGKFFFIGGSKNVHMIFRNQGGNAHLLSWGTKKKKKFLPNFICTEHWYLAIFDPLFLCFFFIEEQVIHIAKTSKNYIHFSKLSFTGGHRQICGLQVHGSQDGLSGDFGVPGDSTGSSESSST